jgi:hypothetical protein
MFDEKKAGAHALRPLSFAATAIELTERLLIKFTHCGKSGNKGLAKTGQGPYVTGHAGIVA